MAYRISFAQKSGKRIENDVLKTIHGTLRYLGGNVLVSAPQERSMMVRRYAEAIMRFGKLRTICAPDETTKARQRLILREMEKIPMHRNAHGFVRGRDSLSCATAHTEYWGAESNRLVVLNMDAKDFFPSIGEQVVRSALEAHGVTESNRDALVSSCMIEANAELAVEVVQGLARLLHKNDRSYHVDRATLKKALSCFAPEEKSPLLTAAMIQGFLSLGPSIAPQGRFLPQGAPTSPMLSNLVLKIVDIRLEAMAKSFNGYYTRYADDLTVSWLAPTKGRIIDSMYRCAGLVLGEYGIHLNRSKKRIMGGGVRQDIVGYCVNSGRPTISKSKRRSLRAHIHRTAVNLPLIANERKPKLFSEIAGHLSYIHTAHPKEAAQQGRILQAIRQFNPRAVSFDPAEPQNHEIEIRTTEMQRRIYE